MSARLYAYARVLSLATLLVLAMVGGATCAAFQHPNFISALGSDKR